MSSVTLSNWCDRMKSMLTSFRGHNGEKRQESIPSYKSASKTTSGKRRKALIKLPWKKRTKATQILSSSNVHSEHIECPLQAMNHSMINIQDHTITSTTVNEYHAALQRRDGQNDWAYRLVDASSYNNSALGILPSIYGGDHGIDDDSDNDSLTDEYDGNSSKRYRPSFRYRLHYGPLVENIENMSDEFKSLLHHETESAQLLEEKQPHGLDSEVSQHRVSTRLPNPSDETLCEVPDLPQAPVLAPCFKASGGECHLVTIPSPVISAATRSIFSAPSLPKIFSCKRVAPVLQDTSYDVVAQEDPSENLYLGFKANSQRIRHLEHPIFIKQHHQKYTETCSKDQERHHVLGEGEKCTRRQMNAKQLRLSRSGLFKECGINDQDGFHGTYDRDDIRSPLGYAETPRTTTFRNWLNGLEKDPVSGHGARTLGRESWLWIPYFATVDFGHAPVDKRASLFSLLSIQVSKPGRFAERTWDEKHEGVLGR
ncbi:hypothetical protein BGZ65_002496 [Modicella reniformis]|uniref:Uncharacterized protein n=1 Tax=Modicella reniformis TaxID=1440133 RepID=A0A9P6IP82_9FUNG|nr:hypothetical protein BGZ65_002496 [Modicella reniformis]